MGQRRGRKSQPTAKRRQTTREGQGRTVGPTPELLDQRKREHGMADVTTEYPLDALAAKGLLCDRLDGEKERDFAARNLIARDTGARLAQLHRSLFGRSTPKAIDPNARGGDTTGPETKRDVKQERLYRQMRQALMGCGRPVHDVVINTAIYARKLPDAWRRPEQRARALDNLKRGLAVLVDLPNEQMERAA